MFSLDGLFKALAAVVTLAFAAIVIAGRGRPAARGYLAAFLLLIAANQGIEAWRTLLTDPGLRLALARMAAVAAALDPAALVLFAAALTREQRIDRWALPLAAIGGLLALWGAWVMGDESMMGRDRTYHMLLLLYTAATYTGVLAWAGAHLARPNAPRWWRPLVFGLAVVALPTWTHGASTVVNAVLRGLFPLGDPVEYWALQVAVICVIAVAAGLLARRWAGKGDVAPRAANVIAALVTSGLLIMMSHEISMLLWSGGITPFRDLTVVGRSSAPARWLLFGAALSLVVLRDEAITFDPSTRRLATRVVAALAALVAAALAFTILSAATQSSFEALPPIAWIALGAALVFSQGFRAGVDRLAARLLPATPGASRPRITGLATGGVVAGRYRIDALLGRGGGGRAFLAQDQTLRRRVVLKEVVGLEADEAPLREARLAGGIQHPNVLTVHDVLIGEDRAVIVTEYASGGTLAELIAKGSPEPHVALRVAGGVLDGLAAVHEAGVVHRDLKPANVFLQGETPKIGDFGIAAFAAGRTAQFSSAPAGTSGYAAPEQAAGMPATKATDVYAAARLIEALHPKPLPDALARVLARALEHDPARRYVDARAMREALASATVQVQ